MQCVLGFTLAEITTLHEELRASLAVDFKASFESRIPS